MYFSGSGMGSEFVRLSQDVQPQPPFSDQVRRPDWRSSSAKRLMPQFQGVIYLVAPIVIYFRWA